MKIFYIRKALLLLFLVSAGFVGRSFSQTFTARFDSIIVNSKAFYEYLPVGYNPSDSTTYPTIITLHGAGDLGAGNPTTLPLLLRSGVPNTISLGQFPATFTVNGQTSSFIVISPQFVYDPTPLDVDNVINYAVKHYRVDTRRIYVTGLSLGGGATWEYAGNQPAYANKIAAIVPVCGLSTPDNGRARIIATANLPVWATHNDQDPTVPVSYTTTYVSEINAAPTPNPPAIKTIFHNNVHDAWTATYTPTFTMNNLNIYQWMLQYSRPNAAKGGNGPIANAGASQTITLPTNSVTLFGAGSDVTGTINGYSWSQLSGTPANINSPASAQTLVTGLTTSGTRVFQLKVTDNKGASATNSVSIIVNGTGGNQLPVVNAGVDQNITQPASTVTLSGTSSDPDGTIASNTWTNISGPVTPTISTPASLTTNITGLTATGIYTFRLTSIDNNGGTSSDDVVVTVVPVTGAARIINVNLFGTATYANSAWNNWNIQSSLKSGLLKYSDGSTSNISSSLSAQTSYSDNGANYPVTMCPQVVGRDASYSTSPRADTLKGLDNTKLYDIQLYASRGNAGQTTRFTVKGTNVDIATNNNFTNIASFSNIAPTNGNIVIGLTPLATYDYLNGFTITEKTVISSNQPPTANAGTNQSITTPASSVTLNGSGTDADGSVAGYAWTQTGGTAGVTAVIGTPAQASTTITGMTSVGTYIFQLTVTDNQGATGVSTVTITVNPVNQPPVANAGNNQSISLPASTATLNGSGTDADGTIAGYAWVQTGGTAGVTATIASASTASTGISGMTTTGTYIFQLTVTDNQGATGVATVTITVTPANLPPTSNAGTAQTIQLPVSTATLTGSGTDADGTIAGYAWTQTGGTAGKTATISSPAAATTGLTGLTVAGTYIFQLKVTDNSGGTGVSTVTITVDPAADQSPVANAGTDQTIALPATTATLTGSGTDADGTIADYAWSQTGGTAGVTADLATPASATTNISGLTTAGTYIFQLTVTDNQGATNSAEVTITVSNATTTQTRVINVNIYGSAIYSNTAWNNWNTVSSLKSPVFNYSDGTASTISSILSAQTSYSDNGPNYPITMCPQVVGRDASYSTSIRRDTLKGLDNSKVYDIQLYASRGNAGQTTRFTINGVNVDIATNSNFTNIATFSNVAPANGIIVITLTPLATYNYLNGFTVTEKTTVQSTGAQNMTGSVIAAGLTTTDPDDQPLGVFPNPVKDQFDLQVTTPAMGKMQVQVVNMTGAVNKELQFTKTQTVYKVNVSSGELMPGNYILRVRIGNWMKAIHVIKL